jgi:hypothetical protein
LLSLTARKGSYIGLLFVAVDLRQGLGGLFVVAVTLAIVLLVVFTPSIVSVFAVVRVWVLEIIEVVAVVVYVVFVVGTVSIGALLCILLMSPLRPEQQKRQTPHTFPQHCPQPNPSFLRVSDLPRTEGADLAPSPSIRHSQKNHRKSPKTNQTQLKRSQIAPNACGMQKVSP